MRSYLAQWHSGMKSRHPPFWTWTLMDLDVMRMREYQTFVFLMSRQKFNGHFENIFFTVLKQNLVKKYPRKYCQ